ncbi:Replic_Relax superfamily protein [Bacillus phage Bolokhovo]|nr:Replic_Relax superfamily protein [Bacillus phage Bolokhovo]
MSDGENTIIMDAWFKSQSNWSALEVDLTQPMKENRKKAKAYEGLYKRGRVSKQLGHFPVVTFITTTEYRRKQLRDACKNFPSVIYTLEDIK